MPTNLAGRCGALSLIKKSCTSALRHSIALRTMDHHIWPLQRRECQKRICYFNTYLAMKSMRSSFYGINCLKIKRPESYLAV
jgi:hypothetical protein